VEHQLGRINIIAWQGRRFHDAHRPGSLSIVLTVAMAASILLLCLRFALGMSLPLELLQVAFAVLATAGSFMLMRALVGFILRLQRP
jgi:hypothetical protein